MIRTKFRGITRARNCAGQGPLAVALAAVAGVLAAPALAPRAPIAHAQSLADTVEAIDKACVSTRILFVTAHPDDEWSSLLTYLSRGLDAGVALLTITRGQGGQNAIGPEQNGELGVIRTEELLAAGKHYGVRQFFTRAVDTGYVKTPEQAMKIWDGLALEDMVRVIRTFRPQVVINGWGGVHGGHGHHQASGLLTPKAVAAAADPKMYPEQIAEGLVPWQASLDLRLSRDSVANAVQLPVNDVSPLWGESYVEMGMEGHAQHRSQGTPAFFGNPFFRRPVYLVTENEKGEVTGWFDAKRLAEPFTYLSSRFSFAQSILAPALTSADAQLAAARKAALAEDRTAAAKALANAGTEIADAREALKKQGDERSAAAIWELERVQQKIDWALSRDVAIPIETQASRHELVAGESFTVEVNISGKAAVPVKWAVDNASLELPAGWTATNEKKEGSDAYRFTVNIPAGAKPPTSAEDAILPFPAPLVQLALRAELEGYAFTIRQAVESVETTTTGIHTYPLELVPAVTLTVEPQQVMVPSQNAKAPVELLARVRYHGTKPAQVSVGLDAPAEWKAETIAPIEFKAPGDRLIRFVVTPPAQPAAGAYPLRPHARIGSEEFRTSLEPIPTLPTRDWSEPADARVHVMDLAVPPGLHVGYIAAENDLIPETLRQIGIRVDMLDEVALAFGDLDRYDAIVVGIRAYELRPDLSRSNQRLLDYVQRGGSLIVQYQRDSGWTVAAPYPAKMPDQTSRVTDASSPVRFLAPENPLLNSPNKITLEDFEGWIQERGLYFLISFDSHYTPVLGLQDPGEPEAQGGLVYAKYGKGVYIYTGLSFFRELPAGVPGAYRLFVNLLSQTQHARQHD